MCAFQGTFAVDIWSIKCCVVDIWSIFGFFVWWSIFDKTPLASLELAFSLNMAVLMHPNGPKTLPMVMLHDTLIQAGHWGFIEY